MHTASFPARFDDSLESIGNLVAQAAREAGFDDNAVYEVQLAVDEAATNIIEHAYGGEGKGEIRILIKSQAILSSFASMTAASHSIRI